MATGQDLRAAREAQGVGLARLAGQIGRDKGHLSRVERGVDARDVTPALVRDYERVLGITVAGTGPSVMAIVEQASAGARSSLALTEYPSSQQTETLFLDLLQRTPVTTPAKSPFVPSPSATALAHELQEIDFNELAQVIVMWLQQFNPTIGRRYLLAKVGAAIALAGAAPLFDLTDPYERERVARVLHDPSRLDAATLAHYEAMVTSLRRQGDVLGPRTILQTILAQRHLMSGLAAAAPEQLKPRAVSVYAELSQLVGWSLFNLGDYQNALYYYDDARTAAHDAHNVDLVTYVLCTMSQLLTWQGKPRVGIDHAVAAASWANQIDSPHARAYAADVAVRAYLADDQPDKCQDALAEEYAALQAFEPEAPVSAWWYFFDESFFWRTEAEKALKHRRTDAAMDAIDKSLSLIDPANLHNYGFRLLFRAEAHIQQAQVTEASTIVGDVASLTAVNSTKRIDQRITALRGALTKWETTRPVRDLDERLAVYRGSSGWGSGSTKRMYSR